MAKSQIYQIIQLNKVAALAFWVWTQITPPLLTILSFRRVLVSDMAKKSQKRADSSSEDSVSDSSSSDSDSSSSNSSQSKTSKPKSNQSPDKNTKKIHSKNEPQERQSNSSENEEEHKDTSSGEEEIKKSGCIKRPNSDDGTKNSREFVEKASTSKTCTEEEEDVIGPLPMQTTSQPMKKKRKGKLLLGRK